MAMLNGQLEVFPTDRLMAKGLCLSFVKSVTFHDHTGKIQLFYVAVPELS